MTVESKRLYRTIKWLWLLLQALILPLAALYAVSPAIRWPLFLPAALRPIFSGWSSWQQLCEWLVLMATPA